MARALAAVGAGGMPYRVLDEHVEPVEGCIALGTMLSELEEVYNTERHLLCVACMRAREYLFGTSTRPASDFLGEFERVGG